MSGIPGALFKYIPVLVLPGPTDPHGRGETRTLNSIFRRICPQGFVVFIFFNFCPPTHKQLEKSTHTPPSISLTSCFVLTADLNKPFAGKQQISQLSRNLNTLKNVYTVSSVLLLVAGFTFQPIFTFPQLPSKCLCVFVTRFRGS